MPRVTEGDSGLCWCACVTSFERRLTPLCVDQKQILKILRCTLVLTTLSLVLMSPESDGGAEAEEQRRWYSGAHDDCQQ